MLSLRVNASYSSQRATQSASDAAHPLTPNIIYIRQNREMPLSSPETGPVDHRLETLYALIAAHRSAYGYQRVDVGQLETLFSHVDKSLLLNTGWPQLLQIMRGQGLNVFFPAVAAALPTVLVDVSSEVKETVKTTWKVICAQLPGRGRDQRLTVLVVRLGQLTPVQIRCGLLEAEPPEDVPAKKLDGLRTHIFDGSDHDVKANCFKHYQPLVAGMPRTVDQVIAINCLSGFYCWTEIELTHAVKKAYTLVKKASEGQEVTKETVRQGHVAANKVIEDWLHQWFYENIISDAPAEIKADWLTEKLIRSGIPAALTPLKLWLLLYYANHLLSKSAINHVFRLATFAPDALRRTRILNCWHQARREIEAEREVKPDLYIGEEMLVLKLMPRLRNYPEFVTRPANLPELQHYLKDFGAHYYALMPALAAAAFSDEQLSDHKEYIRQRWDSIDRSQHLSLTSALTSLLSQWGDLNTIPPSKVLRLLFENKVYVSCQMINDARQKVAAKRKHTPEDNPASSARL